MSLLLLSGDHLIPISPLHQQSGRDPQITFDLPSCLAAALEQLQRFQLEFFRVGPVSWFLLVHHPSPVLPSLLDMDIFCVYFIRGGPLFTWLEIKSGFLFGWLVQLSE